MTTRSKVAVVCEYSSPERNSWSAVSQTSCGPGKTEASFFKNDNNTQKQRNNKIEITVLFESTRMRIKTCNACGEQKSIIDHL
jgi:hypothetical protein